MTAWGDDPELLATFRAEVEERLASLQSGLLQLETHQSPRQVVTLLFRAIVIDADSRASWVAPLIDASVEDDPPEPAPARTP